MPRENAEAKGRRYLVEGRVTVLEVDTDRISARVRGDGQVWWCGWNPGQRWWCRCPARTDRCAHLTALRLVTLVSPRHTHATTGAHHATT
jgi:uncharacterized Zn finger protein